MYSLVYVSSAVTLFSEQELADLLLVSRRNNEKAEVTGMLLYREGNFMQYLEGPKENVVASMERISKDPRHRGILILVQKETPVREFSDWAMGFKTLARTDLEDDLGYTDFLDVPLNSPAFSENPPESLRLLMKFKQSMR